MNEKAQAWLGNLLGWGQRRQAGDAEKLYAESGSFSPKSGLF